MRAGRAAALHHPVQTEQLIPQPTDTGNRAARLAVTVFPVLVLAAGGIGLALPDAFVSWKTNVPYLLGVVMFCMGLTMTPHDFKGVAKRPWAVGLGLVAHYVIMPGLGWLIANALDLPPQLAAGVILVGCAPSGTASNVVTYLARGDVALSVSVATVSTVLAPLVTPPLTLLLAGEFLPVDAGSMVTDILKTVLLPVIAGLVVRLILGRYVDRVLGFLPWLSALTIAVIVAVVVAGSATAIKSAAGLVLLAVVLHNGLGLALGYGSRQAGPPRGARVPRDGVRGRHAELGARRVARHGPLQPARGAPRGGVLRVAQRVGRPGRRLDVVPGSPRRAGLRNAKAPRTARASGGPGREPGRFSALSGRSGRAAADGRRAPARRPGRG